MSSELAAEGHRHAGIQHLWASPLQDWKPRLYKCSNSLEWRDGAGSAIRGLFERIAVMIGLLAAEPLRN